MLVGYRLHTFNCKAVEVSRILVNCHLLEVFYQTLLQAKQAYYGQNVSALTGCCKKITMNHLSSGQDDQNSHNIEWRWAGRALTIYRWNIVCLSFSN